ncbi:MAG: PIN domain-containing protein [Candidatus Omnitrophica bacterium]|nr:PIN domain-containing protein [Candidatus Omnitrophota bacterium]
MNVLVDSSVWIAYFRGDETSSAIDLLISEDNLVTNSLVLTELIPSLLVRDEKDLVNLLKLIKTIPLEIDWDNLIEMQVSCYRNGINKVGIPDLMIAQQCMRSDLELFTLDKHFRLMSDVMDLALYG